MGLAPERSFGKVDRSGWFRAAWSSAFARGAPRFRAIRTIRQMKENAEPEVQVSSSFALAVLSEDAAIISSFTRARAALRL
jgi:hypothetical protein